MTIKAGLIGNPLKHSLSPRIFAILSALSGEKYTYVLKENRGPGLKTLIGSMKKSGWTGFNVTLPLKEKIIPILDTLTTQARAIGAVNAVRINKGRLEGFNTDAEAVRLALSEARVRPRGRVCVIWGAGGAARAAAWVLARGGAASVHIHNRSLLRASTLARELHERFPRVMFKARKLTEKPREAPTIFINATPMGMHAKTNGALEFRPPEGSLRMDFAYCAGATSFLKNVPGKTISGTDLLIYQAIKSAGLFAGRRINAREIVKLKDLVKSRLK